MQTIGPQVPTYAYIFDYRNAPYHFPKMPGYIPGATHTIDIQFLFPNYHGGNLGVNIDQDTGMPRELNAAERKLSDHLVAAWTNFAKTGNPNGGGTYPWARSSSSTAAFYSQNVPTTPNGEPGSVRGRAQVRLLVSHVRVLRPAQERMPRSRHRAGHVCESVRTSNRHDR